MKVCEKCLWFDNCNDAGAVCDFYDVLFEDETLNILEYKNNLKEREEEYQLIVKEFNNQGE